GRARRSGAGIVGPRERRRGGAAGAKPPGSRWMIVEHSQHDRPVTTRRLPRWVLAGLVAAAVAALTSGWRPWFDALGGAFVPADIPQDFAAVHLVVNGVNPYGPEIRQMQAQLVGIPV